MGERNTQFFLIYYIFTFIKNGRAEFQFDTDFPFSGVSHRVNQVILKDEYTILMGLIFGHVYNWFHIQSCLLTHSLSVQKTKHFFYQTNNSIKMMKRKVKISTGQIPFFLTNLQFSHLRKQRQASMLIILSCLYSLKLKV